MDHVERRISNFIRYRSHITPINFGDFIDDAPKNPSRYQQGQWAVNCSLDQFPAMTVANVAEKYNLYKNCIFMTSDCDIVDRYRHLNFRYFPYFIAEGIAQVKVQHELENPQIDFAPRKNILSCVNRFARFHRVYTLYRLRQYNNLANAKISFTTLETNLPNGDGVLHPINLTVNEMLAVAQKHGYHSQDFEQWLRAEYSAFPLQFEQLDNIDNKYDNWVKCEAFSDSYANIVTETYVEDFLPTEKVVKPLLAGCLVLAVSSQNYMKKLQRMGFDLQFEGIDYAAYDNRSTWIERTDAVVELADKIYPDIQDIWQANIQRLAHNRNLFFSQTLQNHVIEDVSEVFEIN